MSLGTDIYSMFLQGRQAAMQNLKNADEIAKEQKKEHIRGLWSKWEALTAPQFDKDGKPIARTTADIVADPRALELINDPIFKDLRTRNTKAVDAPIVGFKKLDETGNQVVPIIRQQYEDGTSSTGPLTVNRSTRGDDQVMGIQANDIHNIIASELYPIDPEEGREAQARISSRAKYGVVSAYRHAKDDNERAQILDAASQYYDPTDIIKSAAGPARVADYEKGGWIVDNGMGTKSFVEDPVIAEQGKKLKAQSLKEALEIRAATKESDLTFDETTQDRKLNLESAELTRRLQTNLDFQKAHSAEERQLAADKLINEYTTRMGLEQKFLPEEIEILKKKVRANIEATAGANYEAAPTVKKTNEVLNPVPAQDEKNLLQAREFFKAKPIEQVTQDDVLTQGKNLDRPGLLGLRAGLLARIERHDASAGRPLASVNALLNQLESGSKAETFKPADYKAESVRRYISSDVSEDVRNKADLNGGALFAQTLEQMTALGLPIVKDSANEARLNRAVAHALVLQEQDGLSNTAPTLYARENLVNKWGEAATGTPDEFSKDLVLPLGKRMQELRTSTDPRTVFEATEDAVALKALGVSHNEAVDWGAKLADPAIARQLGEEAQKAGAKNADDVRRYVAEKIKNQPKPTVAERNRSLSAALDPAPFLEQAPQRIWGGIRDAFQPPAPGAAPSYYQGR